MDLRQLRSDGIRTLILAAKALHDINLHLEQKYSAGGIIIRYQDINILYTAGKVDI